MNDVLYRPEPVTDAMEVVLTAALPVGVTVVQDAADWVASQVVLELVAGPNTTGFGLGGPDYAEIDVQATSVGSSRTAARALGSLVRKILCEVTRHGAAVHPLVIGSPVVAVADPVASRGDGHIGQDDPSTWVETFTVRYQKV